MPSKNVNSIKKGADILKSLSDGVNRISDLSERLDLSKSTTHRLLKSLEKSSLVNQDPISRRYYLGPLITNLASKPIIAHQTLIVCAFREMNYLRDLTRETVMLHIRIGLERIAGGAAISVPVKNYFCPAALSVLGPDNRVSLNVMMGFLKEIKDSALRISKRLTEANQRGGAK